MLVLSRKRLDEILIGADVKIRILNIRGNKVIVGIQAPPDVTVMRSEVVEQARPEGTDEV